MHVSEITGKTLSVTFTKSCAITILTQGFNYKKLDSVSTVLKVIVFYILFLHCNTCQLFQVIEWRHCLCMTSSALGSHDFSRR